MSGMPIYVRHVVSRKVLLSEAARYHLIAIERAFGQKFLTKCKFIRLGKAGTAVSASFDALPCQSGGP